MTIRVTRNFGNLADIPLSTSSIIRELLLLARERVIRRTLAGQSSEEQPFQAYSPGYGRLKRKELGSGDVVNLQVSGRMLNDIVITHVSETRGELGFKS